MESLQKKMSRIPTVLIGVAEKELGDFDMDPIHITKAIHMVVLTKVLLMAHLISIMISPAALPITFIIIRVLIMVLSITSHNILLQMIALIIELHHMSVRHGKECSQMRLIICSRTVLMQPLKLKMQIIRYSTSHFASHWKTQTLGLQ